MYTQQIFYKQNLCRSGSEHESYKSLKKSIYYFCRFDICIQKQNKSRQLTTSLSIPI